VEVTRPREDGACPLFIACELGHFEVVRELLRDPRIDADISKRRDGATPLFMAAQNGHVMTVKCLLSAGVRRVRDVDAKWQNLTPSEQAKRNGHEDVVGVIAASQVNSEEHSWLLARQTGMAGEFLFFLLFFFLFFSFSIPSTSARC